MPVYLVTNGSDIAANVRLLAILSVGAIIGTFLGAPILRRLPDVAFRRVLAVILVVLGLALVAGLDG